MDFLEVQYILSNARGESVNLVGYDILGYQPTGFGVSFSNSYTQYDSYFSTTNTKINQGQMGMNILFGDVESQSYTTFSSFATFLAYQPLTLTYVSPAGTWKREARVNSIGKSEIGGGVYATDKLNESFTLDFINPWYNNKVGVYRTYTVDSNLAWVGKTYNSDLLNDQYNYVRNTSGGAVNATAYPVILGGRSGTTNDATLMITPEGLKMTYTGNGTTAWYYSFADAYSDIGSTAMKYNTPYTLSFDVKGTVPKVSIVETTNTSFTPKPVTTSWTRVSYTFTMVNGSVNPNKFFIRIQAIGSTGNSTSGFTSGQTLEIRHIMLQDGTIDTGWTPAPEDNTTVIGRDYMYGYWGVKSNQELEDGPFTDEARTDITHLF